MSTDLRRSVALAYRDPAAGLRAIERAWCERSLLSYMQAAWGILDPGDPFVYGWPVEAICEHLEAVTIGEINRLIITVPPGFSKSRTVSVFWPSWEWGPMNMPWLRYVGVSHEYGLATQDARRMKLVVTSDWYQGNWGDRVQLAKDQQEKANFENSQRGFRFTATMENATGRRGHRLVCDDLISVMNADSDAHLNEAGRFFSEAAQNRLTDVTTGAIVLIMQRTHERDPAGIALAMKNSGYEHLMIPMEFDSRRRCTTSIGWTDPRTKDGELAWEQRFPRSWVDAFKADVSAYAWAAQYQQSPEVRGGNTFKRDWWRKWDQTGLPKFDYVLASLDTAYSDGEQNDFSALVVLGSYTDENFLRRTLVLFAWEKRLDMHELAKEVDTACEYWNVDLLLIENAAAGKPVQQELRRMFVRNSYAVRLDNVPPIGKVPRAHSIVPFVEDGTVFLRCDPVNEDGEKVTAAEALEWRFKPHAQKLIDRCAKFPRDDHDDMVDAFVAGMRYLRKTGAVVRREEHAADEEDLLRLTRPMKPLYPGVA